MTKETLTDITGFMERQQEMRRAWQRTLLNGRGSPCPSHLHSPLASWDQAQDSSDGQQPWQHELCKWAQYQAPGFSFPTHPSWRGLHTLPYGKDPTGGLSTHTVLTQKAPIKNC